MYRRRKQGFAPPIVPPRGRLLELYRDTLHSVHARELPFYAQPRMASYLARTAKRGGWPLGRTRRRRQLGRDLATVESMLTLSLMQKQFRPT